MRRRLRSNSDARLHDCTTGDEYHGTRCDHGTGRDRCTDNGGYRDGPADQRACSHGNTTSRANG